jgi:hypothetical protein
MSSKFDRRISNPEDRLATSQAGAHKKKWRTPQIITSQFAGTELANGNAVDADQVGDLGHNS